MKDIKHEFLEFSEESKKRDERLEKLKEKIVKILIDENLTIQEVEMLLHKIQDPIEIEMFKNERELESSSYSLIAKK